MAIRAPDGANKKPDDFPTSDFEILPAEGDLKSGIPALTEMPAPHMITMFLYSPLLKIKQILENITLINLPQFSDQLFLLQPLIFRRTSTHDVSSKSTGLVDDPLTCLDHVDPL